MPGSRESMRTKCYYCDCQAIARVRYAKLSLRKSHLVEFVESRVEKAVRRYNMVKRGDKVVVAVSGGKDSVALLYIADSLAKRMEFDYIVLHIDLGIGEYSEKSRVTVEKHCRSLGADCIIIDLRRDLGFTLPDLISRLKTRRACSLCGAVKRYIMNATALGIKASSVATAHHADDMLVYLFKNFITQDYEALGKLSPVNRSIDDIVATKIKPMYEVYEKDIASYVVARGLEFTDAKCPFENMRGLELSIRRFLEEIEDKMPGMKIAILRRFAETSSQLRLWERRADISRCESCGLISRGAECTFCKVTRRAYGQPMGPLVREVIKSKYVW